ncbi:uncharacterized protein LOC103051457 isoform X1 [Python bivittatus]|uniref:Uncharacterized protein LOC103051457 isoform X1 n=1 Tax=Python bivittatus TaxID=176946 RepID=A0A9F5J038_PYTBI|nr:uncharacterized protein LOC103051457 isoform X1 [Python bivittatus]
MPLRLTCDVSVVRRSEPSAEGRPSERPLRARLSLRKPPKGRRGSACVLINTDPHRGSTKYKPRYLLSQTSTQLRKLRKQAAGSSAILFPSPRGKRRMEGRGERLDQGDQTHQPSTTWGAELLLPPPDPLAAPL